MCLYYLFALCLFKKWRRQLLVWHAAFFVIFTVNGDCFDNNVVCLQKKKNLKLKKQSWK